MYRTIATRALRRPPRALLARAFSAGAGGGSGGAGLTAPRVLAGLGAAGLSLFGLSFADDWARARASSVALPARPPRYADTDDTRKVSQAPTAI